MTLDPETWKHVEMFFAGSTALGLIGHAVNSFPTPKNVYGQWLLGCVKFAVGQRQSAMNALRGDDTVVTPVPRGTGSGTGTAVKVETTTTEVTPEVITTQTEKTVKTTTAVPNPNPPDPKG